jgi:hypothetical protein
LQHVPVGADDPVPNTNLRKSRVGVCARNPKCCSVSADAHPRRWKRRTQDSVTTVFGQIEVRKRKKEKKKKEKKENGN